MTANRLRATLLALAVLLTVCVPAMARPSLPSVFSDHMVLQRDMATPVWGWATPGRKVRVRFNGRRYVTTADASGRWMVRLRPQEASDVGRPLKVDSEGWERVVDDVLVGDVWLCSGQSNMEWDVQRAANAREEIRSARHANIRLFHVGVNETAPLPRQDVIARWERCEPGAVKAFSAVGYFFGRELEAQSGVPIGLINSSWGGTPIEPWIPPTGFARVPELAQLAQQVDAFDPHGSGRSLWLDHVRQVEAWAARARHAIESGQPLPERPAQPGFTNQGQPTAIYNTKIAPLAPFGIAGVIWYQGESSWKDGPGYTAKMRALIEGWRAVWGQPDKPIYFYFAQLANYNLPRKETASGDGGWAAIREAQGRAQAIPNTGMVVTIDLGESDDIHPKNKQDVGKRFARWALRDVYGQEIPVHGPRFREMAVEAGKAILSFDHAQPGLMVGQKQGLEPVQEVEDGQPGGFLIAGQDRQWHAAEARIDGQRVVVWSEHVQEPAAVRYAYHSDPKGANLYNRHGLPAAPFRTDDWRPEPAD